MRRTIGIKFIFIISALGLIQQVNVLVCSELLAAGNHPQQPQAVGTQSKETIEELRSRATLARNGGQVAEASRLYRKLVALQPKWAEGWWHLGSINYQVKQYAAACNAFEQLVKLEPDNGRGWGMLGVCESQLQRVIPALNHLKKAVATNLGGNRSLIGLVRYHYAVMLTRVQDFQYAFFYLYAFVLEHQPTDDVLDAMGMVTLHNSAPMESLSSQERTMVRQFGQAAFVSAEGKLEEAGRLLQQLETKYHGKRGVAFAYGLNLHMQFQFAEAEKYYKQELELNPRDVEVLIQLADCALKTDKLDEGLQYARKAIQVDPSNGMAYYFLGRIHMLRNELTEALTMLEKAAQMAPQAYQVQFALSQAYVKLDRPKDADRARAEYERLQAIYQRRIGMVPFEPK